MPGPGCKTVRTRVERLDQLVAVARLLGDQREQQQLQIVGAELAAARHAVVAEIAKAAAPATATERAATAERIVAATMAADRVPDRRTRQGGHAHHDRRIGHGRGKGCVA